MDTQESSTHKELRSSQATQSEECTSAVIEAIENFSNPFQVPSKDVLYCISSGAPAPTQIEEDLLSAGVKGQDAYSKFVDERLVSKTKLFHDPITKVRLKTFSDAAKTAKLKATGNKKSREITTERNVLGQLVLLSVNHNISLQRVLCFPLGPVPWSLASADGLPIKTDKAKLLHELEGDHQTILQQQYSSSYVIDGNALYQAQVALPGTFGELADSLFQQLPRVSRVNFVTDTYKQDSIKGIE